MKNEIRKKRKIEKVKDILEGRNNDLGRMVDRMDEFIDVAKTLNSTIENFKSVRVENLGDIQFPEKLEVSNLDSIPRDAVVRNFPEVQKTKVLNFPEQQEVKFPEIQKTEITNWPEKKDVEEPSWLRSLFDSVLDSFLDKLAVLAKFMWRQTLTVKREDDDRFKPQWVVVIDPETGKPMRIPGGTSEVHTMVANGGGNADLSPLESKIQQLINNSGKSFGQILAEQGKMFTATTNAVAVSGTGEVDFLLLNNPAGSGKTLLVNLFLPSLESTVFASTFRVYKDPVITNNGIALTITNRKNGGPASVMQAFRQPVISNRGTLLYMQSTVETINFNMNMEMHINPGESCLITADPTSNNTNHIVTAVWAEV